MTNNITTQTRGSPPAPKPRQPGRAPLSQFIRRLIREHRGKQGPRRWTEARKEKRREARRLKRKAERAAASKTKDAGNQESGGANSGDAVVAEAREAVRPPSPRPRGEMFDCCHTRFPLPPVPNFPSA